MNILECKNLTKSYKKNLPVLDNLNLTIPAGKIIGLLGPNGCGKSTLIKLVSGLLQADSGEILVDGMPIGDKTNAIISYLPERTYFNSWMRVSQLIDYFAEFYEDFDVLYKKLYDKDKIILISDGVADHIGGDSPEKKLAAVLPELCTSTPQQSAEEILAWALRQNRKPPEDDMSVLVTYIWKKKKW